MLSCSDFHVITYQIGTILPRVYSTLVMTTPPYLGGDTAASGRRNDGRQIAKDAVAIMPRGLSIITETG